MIKLTDIRNVGSVRRSITWIDDLDNYLLIEDTALTRDSIWFYYKWNGHSHRKNHLVRPSLYSKLIQGACPYEILEYFYQTPTLPPQTLTTISDLIRQVTDQLLLQENTNARTPS